MTYRIVRRYQNGSFRRNIRAGLSLDEAQEWCQNPETSSRTCNIWYRRQITRRKGPWFDSYEEEK